MTNVLGNPTLGLQEFGRREGDSPTQGLTQVWVASTDPNPIFKGDAVLTVPSTSMGSNGNGNYVTGMQTITTGSTGQIRGVFMGCKFFQPAPLNRTLWSNNWPGSITGSTGDAIAYIIDDPQRLWIAQASSGPITSSFIGLNIGLSTNSSQGNTLSGLSNITANITTIGATAGLPFRIFDFWTNYTLASGGTSPVINGTDNTSPFNIVVLAANNWDRNGLLTSHSS